MYVDLISKCHIFARFLTDSFFKILMFYYCLKQNLTYAAIRKRNSRDNVSVILIVPQNWKPQSRYPNWNIGKKISPNAKLTLLF